MDARAEVTRRKHRFPSASALHRGARPAALAALALSASQDIAAQAACESFSQAGAGIAFPPIEQEYCRAQRWRT